MASQDADIKVVRGLTPCFIVDGFNYCREECNSYFLTHYHSDHTTGLHPAFDLGRIYCSETTKRLLVYDMGVAEKLVTALPMNEATEVEGVSVTPLDANHCPGSVMFFFHDSKGTGGTALHVGDFRAAASADINHRAPPVV